MSRAGSLPPPHPAAASSVPLAASAQETAVNRAAVPVTPQVQRPDDFVERPGQGLDSEFVAPVPPGFELSGIAAVGLKGPVLVVDMDGGADVNHTDLNDSIWSDPNEVLDNVDNPPVNGIVDDAKGFNVGLMTSNIAQGRAKDHWTHIAGILAAEDNGVGNTGVGAGIIKVMPVAGYYEGNILTNFERGVTYVAKQKIESGHNAVAISCSFGDTYNDAPSQKRWHDAALKAFEANILVVCATANANGANYDKVPGDRPSNIDLPNVLSIAAMDINNDKLATFSAYGPVTVDTAARGEKILSTLPNNTHGPMSGTSMATPLVAGTAGVVADATTQLTTALGSAYPQLHAIQIRNIVLSTVEKDPDLVGKLVTEGKLDIKAAVAKAAEVAAKDPVDWQAVAGTGIVVAAGRMFLAEPDLNPKEALRRALAQVESKTSAEGRWLAGEELERGLQRARDILSPPAAQAWN